MPKLSSVWCVVWLSFVSFICKICVVIVVLFFFFFAIRYSTICMYTFLLYYCSHQTEIFEWAHTDLFSRSMYSLLFVFYNQFVCCLLLVDSVCVFISCLVIKVNVFSFRYIVVLCCVAQFCFCLSVSMCVNYKLSSSNNNKNNISMEWTK